jgi:hypothetical protein
MERPEPLALIDEILTAASVAHEAIWELHASLVDEGRANARTRQLLEEAARIAVTALPGVTREARRLYVAWDEQEVLDPTAAAATSQALSDEVDQIAPELARLRTRQNEIAAELRQLLEG